MDKQQPKSRKKTSLSLSADRKGLILGSIVATLIAITPYLFYLYEGVPKEKVWSTFLFTYTSETYSNVYTLAWLLTSKLIPLYLLVIWFFTCKHWWYHVILVPITMYSFQIISTVYDDVYMDAHAMDTNQLIYLAPFFILILSVVYLVRIKIFDRIYGIDLSELEETQVSVFSPLSDKDIKEVRSFQEGSEEEEPREHGYDVQFAEEDYYRKL